MEQKYQNFIRAIRAVCQKYINLLYDQEEICRLNEYGRKSQPGTLVIVLNYPDHPIPVHLYTPDGQLSITGSFSEKHVEVHDLDKEMRQMIGKYIISSTGDSYTLDISILEGFA